jgi:hypothetical protein
MEPNISKCEEAGNKTSNTSIESKQQKKRRKKSKNRWEWINQAILSRE